MQINPYLIFNGQCETAFQRYAEILGGKITMMMRYGESPDSENTPAEMRNRIIHVHMTVGDEALMGSDSHLNNDEEMAGFSVSINVGERDKGERIFTALADGGTIRMPFGETFWAQGFGMCVDRFGTSWMVGAGQKM